MIQRKKKKGFTLVEMLVVIAIIAVLVAVVTPIITTSTIKAAAATNAANLRAAKGTFTTLKLMYPEEYKSWVSGFTAVTGVEAVGEEFVVSGNAKAGLSTQNSNAGVSLMADAASGSLTVTAKNAVKLKLKDFAIPEGTPMNAQIIKNESGIEEVYVTYNDMPISFFAEVAENGTANPADHRLEGNRGNTAANREYIEKYTERAQKLFSDINTESNRNILGDKLMKQLEEMVTDPSSQGDCMQCAINNLNFTNTGSTVMDGFLFIPGAGSIIEDKLADKGYVKNETAKTCDGYNPMYAGGGCACDATHGKEAHLSTTTKIDYGAGYTDCSEGGFHEYAAGDRSHTCTKCGKPEPSGKKCPVRDTSVPYLGALVDDACMYCGYCPCCAAADEVGHQDYKRKGNSWTGYYYVKNGSPYDIPGGYVIVNAKDIVTHDTGVCLSGSAVLGGGSRGCGHTKAEHMAQGEKITCTHAPTDYEIRD